MQIPQNYVMLRLILCQAAATPITNVPAIAIARGPFVLLNKAPAMKPDAKGIASVGTGVHDSSDLIISPQKPEDTGGQGWRIGGTYALRRLYIIARTPAEFPKYGPRRVT